MPSPPSGSARMSIPFDPSLLQPIVRPKRTPMACVECRRRQVKCSGTTPRCERCKKKGIECTYMSLSEQRASGGSISRSGTPQAAHGGASGQTQQQQTTRLGYQTQWQQEVSSCPTATGYAAAQGWQAPSPPHSSSSAGQYSPPMGQTAQGFASAQMGYPQGYIQQPAVYPQSQGVVVPGGADMFVQGGYGVASQQAYASGTTYNAYGHGVPNMDPTYAFQASQMGALPGADQQSAPFGGQYASQMYFDQNAVQMMSADAAAAQQWAGNPQGYQGHGFPGQ